MKIIDRLDKYMTYKELNDNQITVNCGLSVGLLGKARKNGNDIGKKAIEKILSLYQDINRVWLLTGEGEMLKQERYSVYNKNEVRNTSGNNQIIQGTASGVVFGGGMDMYQNERISDVEKKHKARIADIEAGHLLRLSEMEKKYEALLGAKDELIKEIKLQNERANKTIEKLCER